MLIKSITLTRKQYGQSNSIYGILEVHSQNHGKFYFSTLENAEYKIKKGTYSLRYTFSPRFKYETLQLMGITGRTGIRIHAGNRPHDLTGCIAIGLINKTDEIPNQLWASRASVEILESLIYRETNNKITIKEEINDTQSNRKDSDKNLVNTY